MELPIWAYHERMFVIFAEVLGLEESRIRSQWKTMGQENRMGISWEDIKMWTVATCERDRRSRARPTLEVLRTSMWEGPMARITQLKHSRVLCKVAWEAYQYKARPCTLLGFVFVVKTWKGWRYGRRERSSKDILPGHAKQRFQRKAI